MVPEGSHLSVIDCVRVRPSCLPLPHGLDRVVQRGHGYDPVFNVPLIFLVRLILMCCFIANRKRLGRNTLSNGFSIWAGVRAVLSNIYWFWFFVPFIFIVLLFLLLFRLFIYYFDFYRFLFRFCFVFCFCFFVSCSVACFIFYFSCFTHYTFFAFCLLLLFFVFCGLFF